MEPLGARLPQLKKQGLKVWYDTNKLKWGDSMREKIDKGLAKSRYGVVVLSPNYIAEHKYWTKAELNIWKTKKVYLRCDNSLMKTMVDRFGEDVTTLAYDMTSFRVQTEISASPTFFGWVFGFNGKVQILAPESVKEQYRQMIAKADENMQESE